MRYQEQTDLPAVVPRMATRLHCDHLSCGNTTSAQLLHQPCRGHSRELCRRCSAHVMSGMLVHAHLHVGPVGRVGALIPIFYILHLCKLKQKSVNIRSPSAEGLSRIARPDRMKGLKVGGLTFMMCGLAFAMLSTSSNICSLDIAMHQT